MSDLLIKMFVGFVFISVLCFCGLNLYLLEVKEIREPKYTVIQNYMNQVPEMKVVVAEALQDGKVSNYEYSGIVGEYNRLWFEKQKDQVRRQALDN